MKLQGQLIKKNKSL